jgi:hypothetical protein
MSERRTLRQALRPRWVRMTIAGVSVLTLVLAIMSLADASSCSDTPNAVCDRVFADFQSSHLQSTNDGTPLAVYDNGANASGLAAVDGELTHGAPTGANADGYLEARMSAPVTRIGAIVAFHSENSGAVGLASFADSVVAARTKGSPDPIPNGGIHFAATNKDWRFGVWDSAANSERVLLSGVLRLPADGTEHAFEVARYGDTVTVRLPDGTMQATRDPRIAEWSGPWACWELYEYDPRRVPATITSVWAS